MIFPEQESSTVELKREIPKHNQIVKTIIGFANQFGGRLIIGVADNRNIIGVPQDTADECSESLLKLIYASTSPPILPSIYSLRFEDKLVLVVEVSQGMTKPYFLRSEGLTKGTYVRLGPTTVVATPEIIFELQNQSRGISFEALPVYNGSQQDLELSAIEKFLHSRRGGARVGEVTEELLRSYHLLCEEHTHTYPTVAGVLLFGKHPQKLLPQSFILCTQFSGFVGRDGILASKVCEGTLFEQFESAYAWLWDTLSKSASIAGLKREEQLEIPEEAVREALLNALLHRNWRIQGPIRISIYPNRVEFFSPGVFPGPLRVGQLELGMTHSRNHAIAKVFREAGYVERLGSGFPTIFRTYRMRGLGEPEVVEGVEFVRVILPRGKQLPIGHAIYDTILQLAATRSSVTKREVMRAVPISSATATRFLTRLVEEGKLVRHGSGPTTSYTLPHKPQS